MSRVWLMFLLLLTGLTLASACDDDTCPDGSEPDENGACPVDDVTGSPTE